MNKITIGPLAIVIGICVVLILFYPFLRAYDKKGTISAIGSLVPAAALGITGFVAQTNFKYTNQLILFNIILTILTTTFTILTIRDSAKRDLNIATALAIITLIINLLAIYLA